MSHEYLNSTDDSQPSEANWAEVVKWAESDLRYQMARRLAPGSQVTASSVIGSTLRRATVKRRLLPRSFRDVCNWLFAVACRVLTEKIRNARAWKRNPRDASVLSVGALGDLLADPGSPARRERLEEAMALLPAEEAALLRAIYFERRSLKELSERTGIAPRELSRLHQRALAGLERLIPRD